MAGRQDSVMGTHAPSATGGAVLTGVVRSLQEGVVRHDADGRIVEATPAAADLLGVSLASLVGSVDDEVFGDEPTRPGWRMVDLDGEPFPLDEVPARRTARSGAPSSAVLGVHRPDGTRLWLSASAVPLSTAGDGPWEVLSTFVDITSEVELRRRLSESEQRFRLTFQHAPVGMALVDLAGTYLSVNPRLARMLRRPPEDLVGTTFHDVTHPEDLDADVRLSQEVLDGRLESFEMEKRYVLPDGSVVWGQLAVALVRDADGAPLHFVSQVEDVTEAKRAQQLLEERVLFDPLTGLANRPLTADRVRQAVTRNQGAGRSVALLCCGIDGLKRVNDSLGHAAGDALIAAVGARIVEVVGANELVGRGDGDEFFVIVEGLDSAEPPVATIDAIADAVGRPVEVMGHELRPAVSVGVALGDDADADDRLLHDAMTALFEAKGRGRGEWARFDRRSRDRAVRKLTVESELAPAITRGELELHYQPIVELGGGAVVAYEALARWRHPRLGLLAPARFIPVAQETGLMDDLGAHLLDLACDLLGRWGDDAPQVFVNVSPSQLDAGCFTSAVADSLARHSVAPTRLGLELTESSVLHATGSGFRALHELSDLGVDLVLDDFGTGYSAIAGVLAAPVRGIKLDRSFTRRLGVDAQADLVTRALGGMVEAMGFRGVAEGVETAAQRDALRSLGWRHGQGWFFGRPVPEAELPLR